MRRILLKSKIHRARVTDADPEYEGSVTIDEYLLETADILPWEKVHIWDITNGSRLETYAIPGKKGSGVVCINGAAAHHVKVGDIVIIGSFTEMGEKKARKHKPIKVMVDPKSCNKVLGV